MTFVFDSDILSTFAKIGKLNILKKISGNGELLIPPAVISELKSSKSILLQDILHSKIFKNISLDAQESNFAKNVDFQRRLGKGEIECIAVCKFRNAILATNDARAISVAEKLNIIVADLETILYSLKELISKKQLRQIINDIEAKDNVMIVNKKEILS